MGRVCVGGWVCGGGCACTCMCKWSVCELPSHDVSLVAPTAQPSHQLCPHTPTSLVLCCTQQCQHCQMLPLGQSGGCLVGKATCHLGHNPWCLPFARLQTSWVQSTLIQSLLRWCTRWVVATLPGKPSGCCAPSLSGMWSGIQGRSVRMPSHLVDPRL